MPGAGSSNPRLHCRLRGESAGRDCGSHAPDSRPAPGLRLCQACRPMQIPQWLQLIGALALLGLGLFVGRLWQNGPLTPAPEAPGAARQLAGRNSADATSRFSAAAAPRDSRAVAEPLLSREDLINRLAQCFAITSADERRLEFLHLLKLMSATDARAVLELPARETKQGVCSDSDWHAFWRRWGVRDLAEPARRRRAPAASHRAIRSASRRDQSRSGKSMVAAGEIRAARALKPTPRGDCRGSCQRPLQSRGAGAVFGGCFT